MSEITAEIDQLLADRRPDRYELDGGDEWLDLIADEVQHLIPEAEARAIAARQYVRRREGEKLKAANRLLREVGSNRQLPLDWFAGLNLPISVVKERVALRAARPQDLRLFATEERRRAASDFTSRNQTCEAAEMIADHMDAHGITVGADLRFDEAEAAA